MEKDWKMTATGIIGWIGIGGWSSKACTAGIGWVIGSAPVNNTTVGSS